MSVSGKVISICIKCGAKLLSTGKMIEGSKTCEEHNFQQELIVPTDAEAKALRIYRKNIDESQKFIDLYHNASKKLIKNKGTAYDLINDVFKTLTKTLNDRKTELVNELTKIFNERQTKIENNRTSYETHLDNSKKSLLNMKSKIQNDAQTQIREDAVIEECQNIINNTPMLKNILTLLTFVDDTKDKLIKDIQGFGSFQTKTLTDGDDLIFDSLKDLCTLPIKKKSIKLPSLKKNFQFGSNKEGRVKYSFKLDFGQSPLFKNTTDKYGKCLFIEIKCIEQESSFADSKMDDDDKTWNNAVYSVEKRISEIDMDNSKKKYLFVIDHKFKSEYFVMGRSRIHFKPDKNLEALYEESYTDYQIFPELNMPKTAQIYSLKLGNQIKKIPIDDENKDINIFKELFLKTFKKELTDTQKLVLKYSAKDDDDMEYAFNNGVWTDDVKYIIGKISSINSIKSPISVKQVKSGNSSFKMPEKDDNNNNGKGEAPGEDKPLEYPKKIKFKVLNNEDEKILFLLRKKQYGDKILWNDIRNVIQTRKDFIGQDFDAIEEQNGGDIISNDKELYDVLCKPALNGDKSKQNLTFVLKKL